MKQIFFIVLLFLFMSFNSLVAREQVTTVLLVRHAEKNSTPQENPGLSPQGKARADLLVDMLQSSGIKAVYTSEYARTKLTGEPLARKLGIPLESVDAAASKKLVDTILAKHSGGTVLVVGHSNTLPEIIQAFGAGKTQEIDDNDYNNLYVVTIIQKGSAKLLHFKFFPSDIEQVCQ